jgi:hypothetical protein
MNPEPPEYPILLARSVEELLVCQDCFEGQSLLKTP